MPQQPGSDNGIGYQPAIGPVSRAIRRHWWKIGLTWGVFATGLILSTYFSIDLSFHSRRFVVGSTILAAAMGAVVGLFAWLDARSGLVGDPRRFARRSGLHLLGVIAPLPEIRAGESEDDERAERSLAVFVHTLDELLLDLRFGRRSGARDRRCILLTSAVAGEGKTTLAAHLAARAANTGIPTLLIDGDLRRASLGRLLDMPVGPGLAEVLAGKVAFEEATVTVQAGGFHFLPAGIPGLEPARVLKPDRLQKFLATVRERYELVLIDSPSVLLATDAALIGRHVDGVVLVAKFDESRLPAIKQAVTRLAYVGVPVLGAVMCGVPPKRMAGSDLYAYQFDASRPE